jgi:hypothetical protein
MGVLQNGWTVERSDKSAALQEMESPSSCPTVCSLVGMLTEQFPLPPPKKKRIKEKITPSLIISHVASSKALLLLNFEKLAEHKTRKRRSAEDKKYAAA